MIVKVSNILFYPMVVLYGASSYVFKAGSTLELHPQQLNKIAQGKGNSLFLIIGEVLTVISTK